MAGKDAPQKTEYVEIPDEKMEKDLRKAMEDVKNGRVRTIPPEVLKSKKKFNEFFKI